MTVWRLAVSPDERKSPVRTVIRFVPGEFASAADAMAALIKCAEKRYRHADCYCNQGEWCACGPISSGLAELRAMREDLTWMRTSYGVSAMNERGETYYYMPAAPNGMTTDRPIWRMFAFDSAV